MSSTRTSAVEGARRPGSKRHWALALVGSLVLVLTGACAGGSEDSHATTRSGSSAGDSNAEPPSTNTDVVLSGGALGAPTVPAAEVTAQWVADSLYERGLQYSDGTLHSPSYVSCEDSGADTFDCYVEVPDVAPYWVSVTATATELTFEFVSWAQPADG